MKRILIVLTIIITTTAVRGQTAEDSVKAVINRMFTAMKTADGALLKTCFSDSVIFQTIGRSKEGKMIVRNEDPSGFAAYISTQKPGDLDEQIVFDVVRIDGPLGIAWTPYKFYAAGKFSHCGVNSFQLVRFEGEWKIQYIIDTRRKAGCE